jgi:hypothetical protein
MSATRVVSLRSGEPFDVRIDRRTEWGNPFPITDLHSRDDVIRAFTEWVTTDPAPRARWIRAHVHELRGLTLACWCAPLACHGDVLAAMADEPDEDGPGFDEHGARP